MFHCAYVSPLQGRGVWGGGGGMFLCVYDISQIWYLSLCLFSVSESDMFHCAYVPPQRVVCFTNYIFHHGGWYASLFSESTTMVFFTVYPSQRAMFHCIYVPSKRVECFTVFPFHHTGWYALPCQRFFSGGGGGGVGGICFTVSKFHNTGQCVSLCLHSTAVN